MKILNDRINSIEASPTLKMADKARELKAQGKDIISLSSGEPDFATPKHICDAAVAAIQAGKTHYTPVGGTPELKDAILNKLKRDNKLEYSKEQIVASTGCKQAIFNLFSVLLNPGDEVIIPAPYWVSYADIATFCEAKSVIVTADITQSFKITAAQLEAAITPKTKLVMLNSPCNPSGQHYSLAELKSFAQVLLKYPHVYIASDDIYEHLLWEGNFSNIVNACPELYDRTIVLNGVSKGYAMTGWRIGFAAGPREIIQAMNKLQSQSTSNPCSIAQAAATAAFNGPQQCIADMLKIYKKRHDYVVTRLNKIDGITCLPSTGTFYSFFNLEPILKRLNTSDLDYAEKLLEHGLALVPGTAFGLANHMRLSFAASDANLEQGLDKLQFAIENS